MFKRILVPTDGSDRAEHSARAAIELARFLDAAVVAVYVYPPFRIYPTEPFVAAPELISEKAYVAAQEKTAKRYLAVIEKAAREAGVRCTTDAVEHDSPAAAIVEAAGSPDAPCDLIFIGSHGRGVVSQFFLGSVTTKVQALCDIPVLVYRDPAKRKLIKKTTSTKKTKS
ncbi:MAG: universal stress protein [Usitatibacteraceae bacterium]